MKDRTVDGDDHFLGRRPVERHELRAGNVSQTVLKLFRRSLQDEAVGIGFRVPDKRRHHRVRVAAIIVEDRRERALGKPSLSVGDRVADDRERTVRVENFVLQDDGHGGKPGARCGADGVHVRDLA